MNLFRDDHAFLRFLGVFLLFLLAACGDTSRGSAEWLTGEPFPNLSLYTLSGESIEMRQFKGKVLVVNFWATWCKPCINELNAISDVYDEWLEEKDFRFIAVSTDDARSSSRVKSLVAGKGWPFEFYLDQNQVIDLS